MLHGLQRQCAMHVEDLVCLQKRVTRAAAKVQVQAALELSLQAREPTHIVHTPLVTSNLRTPHAAADSKNEPRDLRRRSQPWAQSTPPPRPPSPASTRTSAQGLGPIRPFKVSQKGRRRRIRQIRSIAFPPWFRSFANLSTTVMGAREADIVGGEKAE